jgi:hypothetical protein
MTPKHRAYLIVIITLTITLVPMLYGNLIAKKGGLMDDTLRGFFKITYLF